MKFFILSFLFISSLASAATLQDVRVLGVKPAEDNVEVKFQLKDAPKDSYFIVDIVKTDRDSFEKLALVMNKLSHKDQFQLNLDIPSFSASPSGSYYRSEGISFSSSAGREPNSSKPAKKKTK